MSSAIRRRERDAVIKSLQAGVVPQIGLRHIQVGRKDEISAILKDLERIEYGGAAVRFIIGRFGSGKSFFLNLSRIVALEKRFVVVQADITTGRRLHSTGGHSRALFSELMQSMATRSKPQGAALPDVVERWISELDHPIRTQGGGDKEVSEEIDKKLSSLQDFVSGYDFAHVIRKYYEGFRSANDNLMTCAIRWLRGEYSTKTEARKDLGVRSIIDDNNYYDYLKLLGRFVRIAGYSGLWVNVDEMGVLSHRLNNSQARNSNYEMILRILNDCLQGNVSGLGIMFAGTDAFLEDRRRGLYSYEALATRLAANHFAVDGLKDFSGPVINLPNLSPEDFYVLMHNVRNVFASGDPSNHLLPDEGLKSYMTFCSKKLGVEHFRTPRDSIKAFVGLLSVLEQNPGQAWEPLLVGTKLEPPSPEDSAMDLPAQSPGNDDLKTFKL